MSVVVAILIGLAAGFASGVAGIGGGVLMVPGMVFLLDTPQHLAQGTSLFAILFTSAAGTVVNVRNGRVNLRNAAVIGIGGAVAAFIAARLANQVEGDVLRRVFGVFVLFSAGRMLLRAWKERRPQPE